VKKLTGDFDNGLGAVLIGERSLASFLSKKSREGISGLFQQYRPTAEASGPNVVRCEVSLLNHLIGRGQQRFRDGEAERLGSLEVYNHLKFGRQLNG
jgi:hypothetical protein